MTRNLAFKFCVSNTIQDQASINDAANLANIFRVVTTDDRPVSRVPGNVSDHAVCKRYSRGEIQFSNGRDELGQLRKHMCIGVPFSVKRNP